MNRGTNSPIGGFAPQSMKLFAAFLGGGAATDGTVAGNGQLTSASGKYPKAVNFGSSLVYTATGLYTVTLTEVVKHILFASAMVVDSGGSPTARLEATVVKIDPATKLLYVEVATHAGVLTDLATSDMLVLAIDAADTTAIG